MTVLNLNWGRDSVFIFKCREVEINWNEINVTGRFFLLEKEGLWTLNAGLLKPCIKAKVWKVYGP